MKLKEIKKEKPFQKEAKVSINIKDIRFGNKEISKPKITTIYQGRKINKSIPFKDILNY